METATVGFSVRTGRAVVVVVRGTQRLPEIVVRYEIELADPWVPESMHPYHHELGDRSGTGEQARRRGCEAALKASHRAVRTVVENMKTHQLQPHDAAVIVGSLIDPARIGGAHPRAHAEEGKLYREAVEGGLRECGVECTTLVDKTVRAVAAKRLALSAEKIQAQLKTFSHKVGTPWRALEKQAALAAWSLLPSAAR